MESIPEISSKTYIEPSAGAKLRKASSGYWLTCPMLESVNIGRL